MSASNKPICDWCCQPIADTAHNHTHPAGMKDRLQFVYHPSCHQVMMKSRKANR